ncbi:MAG: UDP-N-acetylmuramoyl-tripeptide--D-alanyl-D-alanine ligase [Gammaproteobacteria bacterium]|mgnify:CR=1 FL=1|jgi:UDP-N-acetylmuramoyl-tripeptide--D-alanyl-D-alanine ligase|nr:UDP-N-acetylmuramoyl-tripeptide--D-alanyl-D-alanine ligase [Gammaproteobacteria bacterium]
MTFTLATAAECLNCREPDGSALITGAAIDSRQIKPGDVFVAIAGEQVDGHDYIAAAREAGAVAALVSRQQDDVLPQLVVEDVISAFGTLAAHWRDQSTCKVVAVTGSNGKTTVKEMLAAILSQSHRVIATAGNLNNNLGVPLTLFRLQVDTEYAVIEMGANHLGEIAELVTLAKPIVSLVNNVSAAHIEGFGSLEGVAIAKGEIFSYLPEKGIGIVNADMPYVAQWQQSLSDHKMMTFALEAEADIKATDCQSYVIGSHFMVKCEETFHYVDLPLPGKHNIANALAAFTACKALSISIEDMINGLAQMKGVPHRLQLRQGFGNATLIDDTYNANPGSYQQAIATLRTFPGQHWLVLGDFGELGEASAKIHNDLGQQAKAAGVTRLLTVGQHSELASQAFGEGAQHFSDIVDLQKQLETTLAEDVTCLIKGSRFMQLDKLADGLAVEGKN